MVLLVPTRGAGPHTPHLSGPAYFLAALLACAVRPPTDDTSTGASETGDEAGASSAETTAPTTTATTTDTTDTTDDPACSPPGSAEFTFILDGVDEGDDHDLTLDCTVGLIDLHPLGADIALACTADDAPLDPAPSIRLTSSPPPQSLGFTSGSTVTLRYQQSLDFWTNRAIRLTAGETVLLAAVDGSGLYDPFAGVELDPLTPTCPPHDADPCGLVQPEDLQITVDGASGQVRSGQHVDIGTHDVWAPELTHTVGEPICTDVPSTLRTLAVLRLAP